MQLFKACLGSSSALPEVVLLPNSSATSCTKANSVRVPDCNAHVQPQKPDTQTQPSKEQDLQPPPACPLEPGECPMEAAESVLVLANVIGADGEPGKAVLVPAFVSSTARAMFGIPEDAPSDQTGTSTAALAAYAQALHRLLVRDPLLGMVLEQAVEALSSMQPATPQSHATGLGSDILTLRVSPTTWSLNGVQLPVLRLEHHISTAQLKALPRVARDMAILSQLTSPVTLFSLEGTSVLHQNATSAHYFGKLDDRSDGDLTGNTAEKYGPWSGDVLSESAVPALKCLFKYEPDELQGMLMAVASGQTWRKVLRVPPSVQHRLKMQLLMLTGVSQHAAQPALVLIMTPKVIYELLEAIQGTAASHSRSPGDVSGSISAFTRVRRCSSSGGEMNDAPIVRLDSGLLKAAAFEPNNPPVIRDIAPEHNLSIATRDSSTSSKRSEIGGMPNLSHYPSVPSGEASGQQDPCLVQRWSTPTPADPRLQRMLDMRSCQSFSRHGPPQLTDTFHSVVMQDSNVVQSSPFDQEDRDTSSRISCSIADALAPTPARECFHEVTCLPLVDPITEETTLLVLQSDVTARIRAEKALAELSDAQFTLLEEIFPRHVLKHLVMHSHIMGTPEFTDSLAGLAHKHKDVTVFFMDVCGFTDMSQRVDPHKVMLLLAQLFARIDVLVDMYGLYKIETAGDAYLVAANLMKEDDEGFQVLQSAYSIDHDTPCTIRATETVECIGVDPLLQLQPLENAPGKQDDVAASCLQILRFARAVLQVAQQVFYPHNGEPVQIRIGLHTGPLVTGCVGTKLPKFGCFGETMNVGARMEQTAQVGTIQVSAATRRLLPVGMDLHYTGGVDVKGKGMMDTWVYDPLLCPGTIAILDALDGIQSAPTAKHVLPPPGGQQDPVAQHLSSAIATLVAHTHTETPPLPASDRPAKAGTGLQKISMVLSNSRFLPVVSPPDFSGARSAPLSPQAASIPTLHGWGTAVLSDHVIIRPVRAMDATAYEAQTSWTTTGFAQRESITSNLGFSSRRRSSGLVHCATLAIGSMLSQVSGSRRASMDSANATAAHFRRASQPCIMENVEEEEATSPLQGIPEKNNFLGNGPSLGKATLSGEVLSPLALMMKHVTQVQALQASTQTVASAATGSNGAGGWQMLATQIRRPSQLPDNIS